LKSNLEKKLAKTALEQYFRNQEKLEELKRSLQVINRDYPYPDSIGAQKIKMKIRMLEIQRETVAQVIYRLPPERQEFVKFKYEKLMVKDLEIAAKKLTKPVPVLTVQRWNADFIADVEAELLGKIRFDQWMLRADQLEAAIQQTEEHIQFFEGFPLILEKQFIKRLARKKRNLEKLHQVIQGLLKGMTEKQKEIIRCKFFEEDSIDEEVAERCFVARSLVATYSKKFRENVLRRVLEE
jgi:hypothetical protein